MSASDIAIVVPVALRKLIGSRFSTWVAALMIDCCKSDASSEDAVVSIGRALSNAERRSETRWDLAWLRRVPLRRGWAMI